MYLYSSKRFAPRALYSLYINHAESVTLPNMKKMYETIQKSCMGIWKQIHEFLNSLDDYFGNIQNSHFPQNFAKCLEKELSSLVVTADL